MKTIDATLLTHLAQESTTLCLLVKVECVGSHAGTTLGFTDTNVPIAYNDGTGLLTYAADNGFTPKVLAVSSGAGVDNSEIDGVIAATGITEQMIRAGLFDSAKVTIYRVNYNDLTTGRHEIVGYGRAGETIYSDTGWRTEFRSLSQLLKQTISQPYSRTCIAKFGSTGVRWACNKAITWGATGTVTSVGAEAEREFTDTGRAEASGYYSAHGGVVEWLTGNNAGAQMEVDTFTGTAFALALPMPFAIAIGDTYRPRRDCDKLFATCKDIHANTQWFRGQNKSPMDGTGMVPGAEIVRAR